MDKRKFNLGLNALKDEFPDKLIMIESLQRAFNRDVQSIDSRNLRALYQNPSQFMVKIKGDDGEWTTMLHKWADNGLEDLLEIDPLYLMAKNSIGDTVLMNLVQYALGSTTEQINYDLLKKILDKPMKFKYKTGEDEEMLDGCVWDERDISGRTVIDYLQDMASGTGICANCSPLMELVPLLKEWSDKQLADMNEEIYSADDDSDDNDVVDDAPTDEDEFVDYISDEEYVEDCPDDDDEFMTASDLIDDAIDEDAIVEDMPMEPELENDDMEKVKDMTHEQITKSPELSEMDIFANLK